MSAIRTIAVSVSLFVLGSSIIAQTTSRTYHLTAIDPSSSELNEVATIIRTLDTNGIVVDPAKQDITITGTGDELALADWLVQQLDRHSPPPTPAQYAVDGSDNTVRIFYPAHLPAQSDLNELVTTLRTVADIQRIFTYTPQRAIAIRTTAFKVQFADWLVHQMDVTPDNHSNFARADFPLKQCAEGLAEVVFLTHPLAGPGLNEIVTTLRTVADIQAIFTHSATPQGMAFRGCPAQVQFADWLFRQVDAQPDAQARAQTHEYVIADSTDPLARVYYLKNPGPAALNKVIGAIRSESLVRKIFYTEPGTLALRATPDEVAIAERIIRDLDQ